MSTPPGRYNSARRRLQAEQTQRDIVSAARRLFAQQGYTRTSMEDIAKEAGVAVQTVYAAVGNKPSLLVRINDLLDEESGLGEVMAEMAAAQDIRRLIALTVMLTRRYTEHSGEFLEVLAAAAPGEPELGAVLEDARRRHRDGTRGVAAHMEQMGGLRSGVSAEYAGQVLGVMTWPSVRSQLMREYGMTLDETDVWLTETLAALLLAD